MATDTSTLQTSDLPSWAKEYVTGLLTQAQKVGTSEYQPYGGVRFAGYNPLQTAAFESAGDLGPSSYLGQGANVAGTGAGLASLGATNQFTGANVGQYMSPYMQNVVDQQQSGAIRDYARQLPGMSAAASQMGGLGGTRNALVQAEGQRNLQNQLAGIKATGLQNAFQNAQSQFNQQNQNLLQGANIMGNLGSTLGNLGQAQFGQNLQSINLQNQIGGQQQDLSQKRLDAMYQDWLAQQQDPQNKLNFMANVLKGGTPNTQTTSSSTYTASPNAMNTIGGLLAMIYGMGKG